MTQFRDLAEKMRSKLQPNVNGITVGLIRERIEADDIDGAYGLLKQVYVGHLALAREVPEEYMKLHIELVNIELARAKK